MCGRAKAEERLYHWFASKEPYEIKNGLSDIYKEAEKKWFCQTGIHNCRRDGKCSKGVCEEGNLFSGRFKGNTAADGKAFVIFGSFLADMNVF